MPYANRPQCQFLILPHKYRAFIAGYGAGKTRVGSMAMCMHFYEHPGVPQGYFAPTYPQIRDIFYPTIDETAHDMGMNVDIKEGNKEVHFSIGRWQYGTTICRSMENPNAIIGFKIGNALIDELDILPKRKAEQAWSKIIARMRVLSDRFGKPLKNGIDVTTTPEGFRATHKLFVSALQEKPELAQRYGMVQASTYDNEANLPADYIPSLFETYTKELVAAYIQGQFTNLTSGTIYRNYDRVRCASNETIRDNEDLFVGIDFNVTRMSAVIFVKRPNGWHAVAELKDVFDTPDMSKIIKERWQDNSHRIFVYPDATAKGRETVDASRSDITLLEQARFIVRANASNPAVKDRINSVNNLFEKGGLWVNARTCPTVAKCLEGQTYTEDGEPDKTSGFDGQNDAFGYAISYEFPISYDKIHRVVIGGV